MKKDDQELEKHLSEFRPRSVRPLEVSQLAKWMWIRRLAAAALLLIPAAGGVWYAWRETKIPRAEVKEENVRIDFHFPEARFNSIALAKLAVENPREFEEVMEAESRRVLPDFQGPRSTLRGFAKD